MTDHEAALLVASVSAEVADAFRPRLREVERESDRLLGEMRTLRRTLAAHEGVEAMLRGQVAERDAQLAEASAQAQRAADEIVILEARVRELMGQLAEREPSQRGSRPAAGAQIELAIP